MEMFKTKLEPHGGFEDGEWTIMASIIREDTDHKLTAICTAFGTKSVPARYITGPDGSHILHDCHAEVLCRRALVREYLACPEAFDGARLHMYVSAPPCGDCAIFDLSAPHRGFMDHQTGSKLVDGDTSDRTAKGGWRTKPGRGDRSPALSCSDKLVRWSYLGLLGKRGPPIYLTSLIIGEPASKAAVDQSLARLSALALPPHGRYRTTIPTVATTSRPFSRARTGDTQATTHCGWATADAREVLVGKRGLRRGVGLKGATRHPSLLSRAVLPEGGGDRDYREALGAFMAEAEWPSVAERSG